MSSIKRKAIRYLVLFISLLIHIIPAWSIKSSDKLVPCRFSIQAEPELIWAEVTPEFNSPHNEFIRKPGANINLGFSNQLINTWEAGTNLFFSQFRGNKLLRFLGINGVGTGVLFESGLSVHTLLSK